MTMRLLRERVPKVEEAREALRPFGFEVDPTGASAIATWLPFKLFATPNSVGAAAVGRIESSEVSAFQYEYTTTDSDGYSHSNIELVIVAQHPMIRGDARITVDASEWGGLAAFIDVMLWIPPFTLIKAIQLLGAAYDPDRVVGDAEFDRLYRISAASDAEARAAIPQALRTMLLQLRFRGRIELRRGALLFAIDGATRFDNETLIRVLGYVAPLVSAAVEPSAAYR